MRTHLFVLLLVLTVVACRPAAAIESVHREIQLNFDAGYAVPTGEWADDLRASAAIGVQFGVAVTSRLESGVYFGYGRFDAKRRFLPPLTLGVGDHNWARYCGGLFAQYLLADGELAPFVGAYLGMQGTYIEYVKESHGYPGEGTFGFGCGLSSGLRYRYSQRLGTTLRVLGEYSSDMTDGWFVHARLGISVFL